MINAEGLSLASNIINFAALTGKTVFDLIINPSIYKSQLDLEDSSKVDANIKALERKSRRNTVSTTITFCFLAISSICILLGGFL